MYIAKISYIKQYMNVKIFSFLNSYFILSLLAKQNQYHSKTKTTLNGPR